MTVPAVERLRDGLWSVPVVIPDNPLGYTLVYLFETPDGPVLVDNGWDDPRSWAALQAGVAEAGYDVADVYGVLVTHVHPDHHGLSGRVREVSGAWLAMHPEDAWVVTRWRSTMDTWLLETAAVMLSAGAPEDVIGALPDFTAPHRRELPALPTRLFADGDYVDVPGWSVRAVWTPGHSPGHTCFLVDDLLLAGDHVMPRISPHIGLYEEESAQDPLGDYLASLRKVAALADRVSEVLPAHVARFADLVPRVDELAAHHEQRLAAITASLAGGPLTTWDIAASMGWNRAWDDIPAFMKRVALGEALAHLRHLETRGVAERVPGAWPAAYRLVKEPPG